MQQLQDGDNPIRLETSVNCYHSMVVLQFSFQQFKNCSYTFCWGIMSPSLNIHHSFHLWGKSINILLSLQVSPIQQLESKKSRESAFLCVQSMLEHDRSLETHPIQTTTHFTDEETKIPRGEGNPRSHSSGSEPGTQTSVFPYSLKVKVWF